MAYRRRIQLTGGDDGDVMYLTDPDPRYDTNYRGFHIRNCATDGGFNFVLTNESENITELDQNYAWSVEEAKEMIDEYFGD